MGDLPDGPRVVAGFGNGGQRVFVLPGEDLVVTIYAGRYNNPVQFADQILQRILAARTGRPGTE